MGLNFQRGVDWYHWQLRTLRTFWNIGKCSLANAWWQRYRGSEIAPDQKTFRAPSTQTQRSSCSGVPKRGHSMAFCYCDSPWSVNLLQQHFPLSQRVLSLLLFSYIRCILFYILKLSCAAQSQNAGPASLPHRTSLRYTHPAFLTTTSTICSVNGTSLLEMAKCGFV